MKYLLPLSAIGGFLITLIVTPKIIKYLRGINLVVKDMNKKGKPLVPISGGFAVLMGLVAGLMFIIFVTTFFYQSTSRLIYLLAATTSLLIITFIGFIDDLLIKENKESSAGLGQWQKPFFTAFAAVPLMAVYFLLMMNNPGITIISLPFIGTINLGLIYPLILIPIGVVGAANMVNLLAGFNGAEAGMGILYTFSLGSYALINGADTGAIIGFTACGALLAFYFYNKFPAKILPGDSLTYLLGAVIACIAIFGNVEKAALIISIPFFVEFILKLRGKLKKQSYGYYLDGKVQSMYRKIYSIPHILTRTGRFTEKQVSYFMIFIELIFCALIWVV